MIIKNNIVIIDHSQCHHQVPTSHDGDYDVRVLVHLPKVSGKLNWRKMRLKMLMAKIMLIIFNEKVLVGKNYDLDNASHGVDDRKSKDYDQDIAWQDVEKYYQDG